MKNKNLYIGLGVATFAVIAYYMWSKKDKVVDSTVLEKDKSSEDIESKDEVKSNYIGRRKSNLRHQFSKNTGSSAKQRETKVTIKCNCATGKLFEHVVYTDGQGGNFTRGIDGDCSCTRNKSI